MKKTAMAILIVAMLSGCGGSGGSDGDGGGSAGGAPSTDEAACSFDIATFLNGATAADSTTAWACDDGTNSYLFQIYADGTGYSTGMGVFTWAENGCGQVEITGANGTSAITDISAQVVSIDKSSFVQDGSLTANCSLIQVSASGDVEAPEDDLGPAASTAVYNYYANEPYVVYVDTSLYLGTYARNADTDTCSENLFTVELSGEMAVRWVTSNSMSLESPAFSAILEYDPEYPHFDGSDNLQYWLIYGELMCTSSLGSLPATGGYRDVLITVCGAGGIYCGVVYDRANPSAVKALEGLGSAAEDEAIERVRDRMEKRLQLSITGTRGSE